MPIYEFECNEHGYFDEQRPMALAKADAPCPACGARARRVLSVPQLAQPTSSEPSARDDNERSRHEPRRVVREKPNGGEPAPRKVQASHGRPWAIGH